MTSSSTNMKLQTQSTFAQVAEENTVPGNHFHCRWVLWNLRYDILLTWPAVSKCMCLWITHPKNVACVSLSLIWHQIQNCHDQGSWIWFRRDQKHKWMISVFGRMVSKGPCINTAASNWAPPICVHILNPETNTAYTGTCVSKVTRSYLSTLLLWALQEAK